MASARLVPEGVFSHMGTRSTSMISPNLTPLLDVVLQLITFFMMLVHFGTGSRGPRAVRLPVAPAALPGSDLTLDRLPVALDQRGGLRYGGRVLGEAAASAWWAEQAKIRRAGLGVAAAGPLRWRRAADCGDLRADRDASYGTVRRTLAEAQEQGFAKFSLVVLRRERP